MTDAFDKGVGDLLPPVYCSGVTRKVLASVKPCLKRLLLSRSLTWFPFRAASFNGGFWPISR